MSVDSQKIKEHVLTQIHSSQKTPKIPSISSTPGSFRKPTALQTFPKTLNPHLFYYEAFLKTHNWMKTFQSSIKQSTLQRRKKRYKTK